MVCTVLIYLSTGMIGRLKWAQQRGLECHNMGRIYWVAEKLLASQEGLSSMYLVCYVSSYVAKVFVLLAC